MNVRGKLKQITLALALAGAASGAFAGTCVPDPYTAPGGFSGFFANAGSDSCVFEFDVVPSGNYFIELTPSPQATSAGWAADVAGFGSLVFADDKLTGNFDFVSGVTYTLNIFTPAGPSASGYSISGVMVGNEIPVPGTLALVGLGLIGLGAVRRRRA
jgi:PEP-CTERM motif